MFKVTQQEIAQAEKKYSAAVDGLRSTFHQFGENSRQFADAARQTASIAGWIYAAKLKGEVRCQLQ